jgi:isopentenyldiphosphate isomerase
MIEKEFQMSMMGELTFFLGIQIKQTKQSTFIHQAKYMKDLMNKFNMAELKPVPIPMSTTTVLDPNKNEEAVDQREYRSMIGSLLYLFRLVCMFLGFPTDFTSSSSLVNLQVSQINS